jgi:ABC-type transport system involved in multi-copper enzyme maturation permease subunit
VQLWALIVDSFRESLDRKIFWVVLGLSLLVTVMMVSVGFQADRVTFAFGVWDSETDYYNPYDVAGKSHVAGIVVYFIMPVFLGSIGILLMIIATASSFPTMLQQGAIDVLLSKPIGRGRLFLYKYIASMVFVLIHATIFVALTFLVMGLRWHVWVPGYLLCIPLLVLLFSYVYCVSVLVAVKTRSTVAAILISLGVWLFYGMPNRAVEVFESFPELKKNERMYRMMKIAEAVTPKTRQLPYLAAKWSGVGPSLDVLPTTVFAPADTVPESDLQLARDLEEEELSKSPLYHIGTSLLFEAVIVAWGMLIFARKDY